MGCGSSHLQPTGSGKKAGLKPKENGAITNGTTSSKDKKKKIVSSDLNANHGATLSNKPVLKSIAFVVDLDGRPVEDKLLGAPQQPRLKRLAPLNVPKLTADQLAEKQRAADEKREQQLKRKLSASAKSSRRRQTILEAQKLEAEIQKMEKIQESLASAEKSREAKMKDIQGRQKMREEKAKRAREKVKKQHDLDQELDLDVEKDTDYNAEVNPWLSDDNNNDISSDSEERIYSGGIRPKKCIDPDDKNLTYDINVHTNDDSLDKMYHNKPKSASLEKFTGKQNDNTHDFFDM